MSYNDLVLIQWREGTKDDPFVSITDTLHIVNGFVVLSEIPDRFERVYIEGYAEKYGGIPADNEYIVNYNNGLVVFNKSQNGKTITAKYSGRGVIKYPANRIYAHSDNPNVVETIQDILDKGSGAIDVINTLDAKVTEIKTAIDDANTATQAANTAAGSVDAAIANAETATANTNAAIANANSAADNANLAAINATIAISDVTTATTEANAARDAANTAATIANTAANNADIATVGANAARDAANLAATNADTAATTASTAATNADIAATAANTAADAANIAATIANTAASNADDATADVSDAMSAALTAASEANAAATAANQAVAGFGTASTKNVGINPGDVLAVGDNGKIDPAVLPALAITDTFVANDEVTMLALSAQIGDVVVRTDLNKSFILKVEPASVLSNWQELLTPGSVQSVNDKTGAVTLTAADVGAVDDAFGTVSVNGSNVVATNKDTLKIITGPGIKATTDVVTKQVTLEAEGVVQKSEEFIATAGQVEFNITKGTHTNDLTIYIGGLRQNPSVFTKVGETTFVLSEPIEEDGTSVLAVWMESKMLSATHADSHAPGGSDSLEDVYAVKDHNHDSVYADVEHNHDTAYAAFEHNHDTTYAPKEHTHTDITDKVSDVEATANDILNRLKETTRIGTFNRDSVANLPSGVEVVAGSPRYGRWVKKTTTVVMDFAGKKNGNPSVPHVAKYRKAITFDNPDIISNELSDEYYSKISAQDGSLFAVNDFISGNYSYALYSFNVLQDLKNKGVIPQFWTVDDLKAALKALKATWIGYGNGANAGVSTYSGSIKWWNTKDSVWRVGGTHTESIPTAIIHDDKWMALDVINFVNTDGTANFLVHSTYPSDGTIASTICTDYISLEVTVTQWVKEENGVFVEEGTTNLLSANQSSVETDITGFAGYTATLSCSTEQAWHGISSLKVATTDAETFRGFRTDAVTCLANTTYTLSLYIKGTVGTNIRVSPRDQDYNSLGVETIIALTGEWDRAMVTVTTGATTTGISMRVDTGAIGQNATFYVDGLQIEQKPYATSWILGGTTRQAETLTVPTTGLSLTNGSVEMFVRMAFDSTKPPNGVHRNIFSLKNSYSPWGIYWGNGSAGRISFVLGSWGNTVNVDTSWNSGDILKIIATWNTTNATLTVYNVTTSNVVTSSITSTKTIPMSSLEAYVGCSDGTLFTGYINDIVGQLRLSSISRQTDNINGDAFTWDKYTVALYDWDEQLASTPVEAFKFILARLDAIEKALGI